MLHSSVIADVSETLQIVLTDALSTLMPVSPPVAEVHDLQGPISAAPARMTIFLFDVMEDATVRNTSHRDVSLGNLTLTKPQVPLILRYLLTPWSGDRLTDHRILGRALQALHDDAILAGPQLQGGLAGSGEAIKFKLAPLTLEEQTRVWHAVQRPYRLSLTYDVRVVRIDSDVRTSRPPVRSRTLELASGDGA